MLFYRTTDTTRSFFYGQKNHMAPGARTLATELWFLSEIPLQQTCGVPQKNNMYNSLWELTTMSATTDSV